jgi:hypothetical protein
LVRDHSSSRCRDGDRECFAEWWAQLVFGGGTFSPILHL